MGGGEITVHNSEVVKVISDWTVQDMLFQLQAQNRSAKEIKASSEVIYLLG